MRLDKFFSEQKILSRKEVMDCLKKGQITVNGAVVKKNDLKVDENKDIITLRGEVIRYKKFVYILLNKPSGYVSATEDTRDKTVIDLLPQSLQKLDLFPCGRLDKDTVGLVILTKDGASAHNALSTKHHVEKK
jgi:16S rRNA pseudouridine516 synthase